MLWPNNKRLALMLSFDIDAETLWLTRNEINKNHPANLSRGLYSVKQGIPRILRMLEEEKPRPTRQSFTPKLLNALPPAGTKLPTTATCTKFTILTKKKTR